MNTPNDKPVVQPYLFFDGRCDEAIEFYKKALDAKVQMLIRYKESPEPHDPKHGPPPPPDKVMHARMTMGDSVVMVSDGYCSGQPKFDGFSLSVTVQSEAAAERYFNALADGGAISMPLSKTFFSPKFGMVKDRFGVVWLVMVESRGA